MNELSLLTSADSKGEKLYVDSVFSAFTYTGNGATQTITNGIDLAGKGGLVWTKSISNSLDHELVDSAQGITKGISTAGSGASYTGTTIQSFGSSGFSLNGTGGGNSYAATYVSHTFRNAPKFFTHSQVTKTAGSNATVDLSTLGTVGMVKVKRTDAAGAWYVWHRSLTAGQLLIGESTTAAVTLGQITVVGTTLTLVNGMNADGTYHVEAYAHDTSADGIIQCGSFTTDASGNATVNLGWEPQYLMVKRTDVAMDWTMVDTSRAMSMTSYAVLRPNTQGAETTGGISAFAPNATGFSTAGYFSPSSTLVYLAIRRSNKPPTLGTQVYNAIARTGTGAAAVVTGVGFAPDLAIVKSRDLAAPREFNWQDKLRGLSAQIASNSANSEASYNSSSSITAFGMDGTSLDASAMVNAGAEKYINHFFKRAPGVFDVVCYTGDGLQGSYVYHKLGVIPELVLIKSRASINNWAVYAGDAMTYLSLNTTTGKTANYTLWNNATPTKYYFWLGNASVVNTNLGPYVAYLFATKPGISKIFSFTGNGTSQTINCGFTTGARFVLIKRTDATGDWFIWDTVRGIVAGNDPHLSLNSTAAEVTTDDSIDPDVTGFIVNQLAATNINVSGASYIGLAYA